jgi:large subunit ribosomal protein L25
MTKITLKAEVRKITGRKVKTLRAKGIVPANIYGKDVKSKAIQVSSKELREVFKKAGETGIVDVLESPVLIHNIQTHPATGEILHVDFLQVNLKEKVTAQIPVEVVGESPVEKSGIGTVVILVQEIEVEALPGDLPQSFEIDATILTEVEQAVKISDLKYDKEKVEIKADPETILVKVEPPQKEEIIQPTVVEETQEGTTEEKPAEEKVEEKPEESKA